MSVADFARIDPNPADQTQIATFLASYPGGSTWVERSLLSATAQLLRRGVAADWVVLNPRNDYLLSTAFPGAGRTIQSSSTNRGNGG